MRQLLCLYLPLAIEETAAERSIRLAEQAAAAILVAQEAAEGLVRAQEGQNQIITEGVALQDNIATVEGDLLAARALAETALRNVQAEMGRLTTLQQTQAQFAIRDTEARDLLAQAEILRAETQIRADQLVNEAEQAQAAIANAAVEVVDEEMASEFIDVPVIPVVAARGWFSGWFAPAASIITSAVNGTNTQESMLDAESALAGLTVSCNSGGEGHSSSSSI